MDGPESEGLGLSLLVYLGAILSVFAVLAIPAYYLVSPTVYANPPLAAADQLLNGSIVGVRSQARSPVAALQPQVIADAETAAFKTRAKKPEATAQVSSRPVRRDAGTPVAELQPERRRPALFPFSLF